MLFKSKYNYNKFKNISLLGSYISEYFISFFTSLNFEPFDGSIRNFPSIYI